MEHERNKTHFELLKIASEIIAGIILVFAIAFLLNYFISAFFPHYKHYEIYIMEGAIALITLVIGLMVTRSILKYIEFRISTTKRELYGISLIIRIVMYIILIAIVLSIFHFNITGILAGSAIGGVVLGLAVQSVASNVLSSVFVTSSKTLKYGEVININSWAWSINTTGKIIDIKTLFSKMLTKDNNIIHIPNSQLLGNSVITEFRNESDAYTYPVTVTTFADVPSDKLIDAFKSTDFGKENDIYLYEKLGTTNVFLVLMKFKDVTELNKKLSDVNMLVDRSYWNIKSNIALMGNNAVYENISGNKIYPLNITLNSDVPSDRIIDYVNSNKGDFNFTVFLITKSGGTNTFTAKITYDDINKIDDAINRINMIFEEGYSSIKNNAAK